MRTHFVSSLSAIMATALLLAGCGLFDSRRAMDGSRLSIDHKQNCDVDLTQAARAGGDDDADVVENVTVHPDCTTTIEFRQVVGDGLVEIESQGGLDILEHGQAAPPAPAGVPVLPAQQPAAATTPETSGPDPGAGDQ